MSKKSKKKKVAPRKITYSEITFRFKSYFSITTLNQEGSRG